jgi:hypothetical protein
VIGEDLSLAPRGAIDRPRHPDGEALHAAGGDRDITPADCHPCRRSTLLPMKAVAPTRTGRRR